MDLELKSKTIIVTGSTRGIGYAIAESFLIEGSNVVINGRNIDKLKTVESSFLNQFGENKLLSVAGDATNDRFIDKLIKRSIDKFGSIDCVVANVGSTSIQPVPESTQDWIDAFKANFIGSAILAIKVMPYLKDRPDPNIIFISSIAGNETIGAPISYASSKAMVNYFSKSLASSDMGEKVRFNVVSPGNIFFPGGNWEEKYNDNPVLWDEYLKSNVPIKRFGTPQEVANAVLFLASSKASFITGTCLIVDGGQTNHI